MPLSASFVLLLLFAADALYRKSSSNSRTLAVDEVDSRLEHTLSASFMIFFTLIMPTLQSATSSGDDDSAVRLFSGDASVASVLTFSELVGVLRSAFAGEIFGCDKSSGLPPFALSLWFSLLFMESDGLGVADTFFVNCEYKMLSYMDDGNAGFTSCPFSAAFLFDESAFGSDVPAAAAATIAILLKKLLPNVL